MTDGAVLRDIWNRARPADAMGALIVLDEDRLTVRIVRVVQERGDGDRHAAADQQQRENGGNAGVPKKPEHWCRD